ncbi:MAG: zinc-dependent peptidase [Burkholderiaceae bacterium]|jgi:Mlc titration factor MtfA (ptsG expression regulator)
MAGSAIPSTRQREGSAWWRALFRRWRPAHASDIPEGLWRQVIEQYPFLAWRTDEDLHKLRHLSAVFLSRKEFHGAQGFPVTDPMALAVAAQACLPVLQLGLKPYEGFVGIVMHEGPVRAQRETTDAFGLVHTWQEELVGEATGDGPVMLSWTEGAAGPEGCGGPAFNVVIHEFVHVLDGLDGTIDGTPPLSAEQRMRWQRTMQEAFDRFDERSACGYPSIIDHYGAQDVAEFFAVTSEAFFTQPAAFQAEQPALFALYADFYRQDPRPAANASPGA